MFPICFSTLIVFPFVICFAEIRCWASWNRRLYPISPLLYSDQVDGSRLQPLAQLVRCLHSALVALLYTCVAFHLCKSSSLKSLLLSPHVQSLVFSVTTFCGSEAFPFDPLVLFALLFFCTLYLSYDFLLLCVNHLSTGEDRPIRHLCSCQVKVPSFLLRMERQLLGTRASTADKKWKKTLAAKIGAKRPWACADEVQTLQMQQHANLAILQGSPAFSIFLSIKIIQNASRTTNLGFWVFMSWIHDSRTRCSGECGSFLLCWLSLLDHGSLEPKEAFDLAHLPTGHVFHVFAFFLLYNVQIMT